MSWTKAHAEIFRPLRRYLIRKYPQLFVARTFRKPKGWRVCASGPSLGCRDSLAVGPPEPCLPNPVKHGGARRQRCRVEEAHIARYVRTSSVCALGLRVNSRNAMCASIPVPPIFSSPILARRAPHSSGNSSATASSSRERSHDLRARFARINIGTEAELKKLLVCSSATPRNTYARTSSIRRTPRRRKSRCV